jgi:hypothetical protein
LTHQEPRDAAVPASISCYRVEHRAGDEVVVLGYLEGVAPHHTILVPFVSTLLHHGAGGQLVLIDTATGAVVARRRVRPFGDKGGDPFRWSGNRGRRGAERPRRF